MKIIKELLKRIKIKSRTPQNYKKCQFRDLMIIRILVASPRTEKWMDYVQHQKNTIMHDVGHALYWYGIPQSWWPTPRNQEPKALHPPTLPLGEAKLPPGQAYTYICSSPCPRNMNMNMNQQPSSITIVYTIQVDCQTFLRKPSLKWSQIFSPTLVPLINLFKPN